MLPYTEEQKEKNEKMVDVIMNNAADAKKLNYAYYVNTKILRRKAIILKFKIFSIAA